VIKLGIWICGERVGNNVEEGTGTCGEGFLRQEGECGAFWSGVCRTQTPLAGAGHQRVQKRFRGSHASHRAFTLCAIKAPAEPLNILTKPTDSSSVMQRNSPTIGKHTCHSFNSEDVGAWGSGRAVCRSERSARMMGLRGPGVSASLVTRVSGET